MYVRERVVEVRKGCEGRWKSVREQGSCKLFANVWEMKLVVVGSTPLNVIKDSGEVKKAAVKAVGLGGGGAGVVGVSPIPNVAE